MEEIFDALGNLIGYLVPHGDGCLGCLGVIVIVILVLAGVIGGPIVVDGVVIIFCGVAYLGLLALFAGISDRSIPMIIAAILIMVVFVGLAIWLVIR